MDQQAAFQQFMQNPIQNLINVGLSIPQGMNDPNAILNYLLSNNMITQELCNKAMMMSRSLSPILMPRR